MELQKRILASAPGRVDIGGRVDIPALFCQFPSGSVGTCNIAIGLRTTIVFSSAPHDSIVVRFGRIEERGRPYLNPDESALPYFWIAAREFRAPCGTYAIDSAIPRGSGLGGSSAFVIALLSIVTTTEGDSVVTNADRDKLITRAYQFENGTGLTSAGFQDYLAAVYGGMNHWSWGGEASRSLPITTRRELCGTKAAQELDGSLVVAFTGEPHASNCFRQGNGGLRQQEHTGWLRVGDLVKECAQLLYDRRWRELAGMMMEERELWVRVSGEPMSPRVRQLLGIADALGLAARFAGVPSGGSVWAIGSPLDMARVMRRWSLATSAWDHGLVQRLGIDRGLMVVIDA